MKHTILISVEFYFKGKKHSPSLLVDLDLHVQTQRGFESLYPVLAKSNNIDLYSYEYEMMQAETLVFSEATGLAVTFLIDGQFDYVAFEQALNDEKIIDIVSDIASEHLSVDDLSSQPDLKAALFDAFKQGQNSKNQKGEL